MTDAVADRDDVEISKKLRTETRTGENKRHVVVMGFCSHGLRILGFRQKTQ